MLHFIQQFNSFPYVLEYHNTIVSWVEHLPKTAVNILVQTQFSGIKAQYECILRQFIIIIIITEALKEMEKVASHINEMQKIYEDYGAVFDQLVSEQSGAEKEVQTHI